MLKKEYILYNKDYRIIGQSNSMENLVQYANFNMPAKIIYNKLNKFSIFEENDRFIMCFINGEDKYNVTHLYKKCIRSFNIDKLLV
jgi:hypothetical protein